MAADEGPDHFGPAPPESVELWIRLVRTMDDPMLADFVRRTWRTWDQLRSGPWRRLLRRGRRSWRAIPGRSLWLGLAGGRSFGAFHPPSLCMVPEFSVDARVSKSAVRLGSGVVFGVLNEPIYFELRARGVKHEYRYRLSFVCKQDPEKKPFAVERSHPDSDTDVTEAVLVFYNPSAGSPSGLLSPTPLFVIQSDDAGTPDAHVLFDFMFYVDILRGQTRHYRLSYEIRQHLVAVDAMQLVKSAAG